jgi:hypothetical protein
MTCGALDCKAVDQFKELNLKKFKNMHAIVLDDTGRPSLRKNEY